MAQDRAEAARERQSLFLVDRNLRDAEQLIFDRIFDGDNLVFRRLDLRKRRVQGCGLAATRGSGHQYHAVRLGDVLAKAFQLRFGKTEDIEPELGELLAERFLVE